jgi:hypothetical protein
MRHHLDPPKQHEAADRLGRMVARGEISDATAAEVMGTIVRVARENAPNSCPLGLKLRLVWAARDAKASETLAMARLAREQEQALSAVAEAAIREGGDERAVRAAVAARAAVMDPVPDVSLGDAALRLARWRVKHG